MVWCILSLTYISFYTDKANQINARSKIATSREIIRSQHSDVRTINMNKITSASFSILIIYIFYRYLFQKDIFKKRHKKVHALKTINRYA